MPSVNATPVSREVRISVGDIWLYGDLVTPPGFQGLVLFAHGSGSGRHSARNRQVAQHLQHVGIATLLFDLLTAQEEQTDLNTREHRFDISLLTRRMQDATAWAAAQPELQYAAIGYFGASTGSAAALFAAARLGHQIAAGPLEQAAQLVCSWFATHLAVPQHSMAAVNLPFRNRRHAGRVLAGKLNACRWACVDAPIKGST